MRKFAKLIIALLAAILPCGTAFAQTDENIVDITALFTDYGYADLINNDDGSLTFVAQQNGAYLVAYISADWTGYKSLTFEFSEATPAYCYIYVGRSNQTDGLEHYLYAGSEKVTIEFGVNDMRGVSSVQIYFNRNEAQGLAATYKIKRIYLTKTNFDKNKITIDPAPGKVTSLKDFTLDFGGQEVSVNNEIKARLGEGLGDITQKSDGKVEINFAEMVKPGSYQLQIPFGAIISDTRPIGELLYNYTIDNFSKLQVNEGTKTTMLKESGKEEYYQKGVELKKGDQLHAFYCSDKEWMRAYPVDGGLKIEADGTYDVYFIPGEGRLYVESKTEATIKVSWNDAGNEAGKRPKSLTYRLSGNGNATGKEVTLNEECSWTGKLTELPGMESNKPIEYTWSVKESLPEEYVLMDESTVDTKTTLVYGLMTVTLSETSPTYDGTDVKPAVTVKLGDTVIGKDEYMVKYMVDGEEVTECIESGEYTVVVSDKEGGKYTLNETTLTFIVVRPEAGLAYLETNLTVTFADPFEVPQLQNPHELSPINYSSSDESVATVDAETGEVTLLKSGETTITATFGGDGRYIEGTASYTLTVEKGTPVLAFSETDVEATYGEDFTEPELTTTPEDLTVTYASSDEEVATVDEDGEVTLLKSGEVTITATFAGNDQYETASASYTLTVKAAETSVELAEESLIAYIVEEIESPEATTDPEDLTLTWTSADESIATVDAATGVVTPLATGTTTITAAFEGNAQYLASEASYTLIVRHRIELLAPEFSLASGTEAEPTPLAADEPLKVTFATEYLEENELTEDDVMVKVVVSLTGDVAGKDLPPTSKTAHVVESETFYLPLGESDFPEALKYGYTYDKITIESAELVINAETDDEEVVATCKDVPAELEWIGVQPRILDGMIKQILSHPQTGKQGEATGEQTVTISPSEDPGEVDITYSGFTMPVTGAIIPEFTVTGVTMTENEDGTITYSLPSYASNQVVIDRGTGDVKYTVALEGSQKDAGALPVLKLTLTNSVVDTVWFGADESVIDKAIYVGVEDLPVDNATETIFDLSGRKLDKVQRKGVYIINGKKVAFK